MCFHLRKKTKIYKVANAADDGAVGTLAEIGVVTGYDNGTFHPEQTISRAEMWVMVYRVLMRVVEDLLVGIAAWRHRSRLPDL